MLEMVSLNIMEDDSRPLTTKEFYSSLNDMGITNNKYQKFKQKYYNKTFVHDLLLNSALNHIKYENRRIEKEIEYSIRDNLDY